MSFEGLAPVRFESVSAVTLTNTVDLGTRATDGGNEYIYVYNAGNSQISKGHAAILSAATGYSVTVSSITMVDFALGMVKHSTMATATYGWLLTKGFATFIAGANDSFAAGNPISLGIDGAFVYKTISTGFVSPAIGKAVQATASGVSAGYGYFSF